MLVIVSFYWTSHAMCWSLFQNVNTYKAPWRSWFWIESNKSSFKSNLTTQGTKLIFTYMHLNLFETCHLFLSVTLPQTKEALFTILRDLRPADRFNFISFSNRIKVWQPHRLVPVTPLTVRDAKKFIFTLMPTGGETLLSSWFVLFTFLYFDKYFSVCWSQDTLN